MLQGCLRLTYLYLLVWRKEGHNLSRHSLDISKSETEVLATFLQKALSC